MPSVVLRFAGPLQSWGGPIEQVKDDKIWLRPTEMAPTDSAVRGMLAAALGIPRGGERPDWFGGVTIDSEAINPGREYADFHLVSEGDPRTAEPRYRLEMLRGKRYTRRDRDTFKKNATATVRRPDGKTTSGDASIMTRRSYLAGAEFKVTLSHDDPEVAAKIETAFRRPVFDLYLGRKACPATFPLVVPEGWDGWDRPKPKPEPGDALSETAP